MDVISFFRNIDGAFYYVMAIVNTILIFAIIGYLGEKNNEKIVNMGMRNNIPTPGFGLNLNPITERHNDSSIPTVAPTMVNNPLTETDAINVPVEQNAIPDINNENINNVPNSVENTMINNKVNTSEKPPAVLVINSNNTDMPK